jgi:hypothetical protein
MEKSLPGACTIKRGGSKVIFHLTCCSRPTAPAHEIGSEKDRFSRPENSAYTAAARSVLRWRNTVKNSDLVTTSHLFWPNQRRQAVFSLRNWQPNSANCPRGECNGAVPPGGGSVACRLTDPSTQNRTRNFMPNRSPTLFCCFKKYRPGTAAPALSTFS